MVICALFSFWCAAYCALDCLLAGFFNTFFGTDYPLYCIDTPIPQSIETFIIDRELFASYLFLWCFIWGNVAAAITYLACVLVPVSYYYYMENIVVHHVESACARTFFYTLELERQVLKLRSEMHLYHAIPMYTMYLKWHNAQNDEYLNLRTLEDKVEMILLFLHIYGFMLCIIVIVVKAFICYLRMYYCL